MLSKDSDSICRNPSNLRTPVLPVQIKHLVPQISSSQSSLCYKTFRNSLLYTSNPFHLLFPTAQCSSNHNNVPQEEATQTTQIGGSSVLKMPGFSAQRVVSSENITAYQINEWMAQETGVDRLKQAYAIREWKFSQEDTRIINLSLLQATPLIFGLGVYLEAIKIAEEKKQQKQIFLGKLGGIQPDAVYVWKRLLKQTARLALASVIVLNMSHSIAVYQNESTIEGMALSTVVASGVYYMGSSRKVLLRNLGLAALVGAFGGFCVNQYLAFAGWNQEDRHQERVKQHILDKRSETESSRGELL